MSVFPPFSSQVPDREMILAAVDRIGPYINHTPILTSRSLNRLLNAEIYLKCENFQKVGAFKARGATNAILSMPEQLLKAGVCTHSSGNHAQALSWAASLRNCPAHIVMPENSSRVKIEAVKNYGGLITFCEPTLIARETTLLKIRQETGATEVHPYNNYTIIAGQATAALELIQEKPGLDFILAPVGGGGLLSGTALAVHYFSPGTSVVAAEPLQANDAYLSFMNKSLIPAVNPDTTADGLRTSLGTLTFPILLSFTKGVITASEKAIISAMRYLWERMKIIVEPSAAVPLAALLEKQISVADLRVGIIVSGGNVDLDHLPWKSSNG